VPTMTAPHDPAAFAFPADFAWGVATAAFQIEGAASADGKGQSIWDEFCRRPGVIADASNGDVACEHHQRWAEDLDLIASLGVNTYRFSISWPRVRPDGSGAWNEAGLAFYDRLIDGLLARGITPHLTLNHWDLPQALQQRGGWVARDTVHHFVDYAQGIAARLGDRVAAITTHNEPWVMAMLGHDSGIFAPGVRHLASAMQVSHHLLLSHGLALQALRAQGCRSELGIVLNLAPIHATSDDPAALARARLEDGRLLRWYLDPLMHGRYPEDVLDFLGSDAPTVQDGDLATIATPIDYLGINYYSRSVVDANGTVDPAARGMPLTDMGWEIYPDGLTELLVRVHRDYAVPALYVTENGGAFKDPVVQDAQGRPAVHDGDRCDYLARHIAAVGAAMRQGVPMRGYMVWSLMDNFEWASGYAKRFGIVHVDYATQQRTPKDSARWYQAFLQQQRAIRPEPASRPALIVAGA
jgi:beta-glucosidase